MRRTLPLLIAVLFTFLILAGCSGLHEWSTPSLALSKSQWRMASYLNEGGDLVPVSNGTAITLGFSREGTFSGSAGPCTHYSGSYSTMGEVIDLTNISRSAGPGCTAQGTVTTEEERFFALLPNVTRFNEENGELVLSYYDVKKMLIFSPV